MSELLIELFVMSSSMGSSQRCKHIAPKISDKLIGASKLKSTMFQVEAEGHELIFWSRPRIDL